LESDNVLRAQLNKQSVYVLMVVVAAAWHLVNVSVAVTFSIAVAAHNGNKNMISFSCLLHIICNDMSVVGSGKGAGAAPHHF
jgi:hypothetical protein